MTDRRREPPETLQACCDRLSAEVAALRIERAKFVAILDTFRLAPLSVSSVQPILDLAEELNGAMA